MKQFELTYLAQRIAAHLIQSALDHGSIAKACEEYSLSEEDAIRIEQELMKIAQQLRGGKE